MTNKQVENIISSYEKLGIVNPSVGINYPPKQYLSNLLENIKELLFPGFFGVESLNNNMLQKVTTERIAHIRQTLQTELKKCLQFAKELK